LNILLNLFPSMLAGVQAAAPLIAAERNTDLLEEIHRHVSHLGDPTPERDDR